MKNAAFDFKSKNSYTISMKARVSEKGQVTIPKALRTRLGIRPGATLDFEAVNGRLVAKKVGQGDSMDALFGILKSDGRTTDEIIDEMRGGPADL
ncbi:MAG: AbrB/MazE/SpoVT family DNA-binding domain-containing protein [Actinomycetota bacterium]|nr:AbrB/MazE/SpoVT family DNA-binding domain-containing protein [Actinomycetota bacterium]